MIFRLGKLVFIVIVAQLKNANGPATIVISFPVGDGVIGQMIM